MKQLFYYFLLLAPVLAVAGSDNEGAPSKEKEGAENRPAAQEISPNDSRIFAQLCNASINNASNDNPKITALKRDLIDICEKKHQNYFDQNPDLTGAEAFAIVEKELKTVYEGKDLDEKELIKVFKDLSPQKLFKSELQKAMGQWEARIDTFIAHEENKYSRERLESERPQILDTCKNLFKTWYHDRTNQPERTVAELIEERLQLLMTAHASNYDEIDLSVQLADSHKSTQDVRKELVQQRESRRDRRRSPQPYSLESSLTLDSALNQGLSQTKTEQKNYIKELIEQVKTSGNMDNNLDKDLHREIYWGKYSDWATLSEEDVAYNLIDSYFEKSYSSSQYTAPQQASLMEQFSRNSSGGTWKNPRLQKWADYLTSSMSKQNPNPIQGFFTLAKIVKYSIDPEKTVTETLAQLEKDLGEMLPPAQKDDILKNLDQENIHRVLLAGRLPYNLKGLGVVTNDNYSNELTIGTFSGGCSDTLGLSFGKTFQDRPITLKEIDLEAVGWKQTHPRTQHMTAFIDEDRSAIQNLHKDLFYEKTLERLKEIGLLSSEKTEALLNLEAEDLGQSRKIPKKD